MSFFFRSLDGSFAFLRTGTLLLITALSTTSQYFVLIPWYTEWQGPWTQLGLFNLGIFLIYWTFFLACQDPGAVQSGYVPPDDAMARYCKSCKNFKPPRTHHCKSCNRCVLRMDHHCPWLSSCVGYRNHAAFIKFMLCVVPTCSWLSIMMGIRLYHLTCQPTKPSLSLYVWVTLNLLWCICDNITTIESWSKKKMDDLIQRQKIPSCEFPYDLYSTKENLREILGHHHPLMWLWPNTKANRSGHNFPVNEDAELPWPPAAFSYQETNQASKSRSVGQSQKIKPDYTYLLNEEDLSYDDYGKLGFLGGSDDSDSDGEYINPDGENLHDYGVDDEGEIATLDEIIDGNLTMRQVLRKRRNERT